MIDICKTILLRDLATLRRELEQYPDDASLWRVLPGIANPGGNLALHLAGNLQFFIGEQLGHSGYVRDRDREFQARGLDRAQVLREVDAAARVVEDTLATLDPGDLDLPPATPAGGGRSLVHLCAHLAYHLGQVNYHRRMVGFGRNRVTDIS